MKQHLEVQHTIAAPAERVWERLLALPAYSEWNARTQFQRAARVGERLIMRVRLLGVRLAVPIVIESCSRESGLRWRGGIPGIFTGSHYFRIEAISDQQSRLIQGEDFEGVLVGALLPMLRSELLGLYQGFGEDLARTFVVPRSTLARAS